MRRIYEVSEFCDLDNTVCCKRDQSVPSTEEVLYIFQKARDGNEMAAIQLYEWNCCCCPRTDKDKLKYQFVNEAFHQLFAGSKDF